MRASKKKPSGGKLRARRAFRKYSIAKRSIRFNGHKTSVSLEDAFWNALKEIAGKRAIRLSNLIAEIDDQRGHANLSSALRHFVLDYYQGP
jgi:predicted DNA-binding ribbon-helix-helix protein